ncbi:MAG: hypothetical protein V8R83_12715 [Candidatus Gastranaerophilaceae bacterium]
MANNSKITMENMGEVRNMVSAVGSIGSYAASIFQYQGLQSTSNVTTDSTAISFDDMVSNGMIDVNSDDSSSTGVTAMGGGSGGGSSSGSKSEMDLNGDGQVTSDEVIKDMQMQMMEKMSEQMSSDDGTTMMGQQSQQLNNGIEEFKNKQAASAYQSVQNSLIDMITDSFMI